MSQMSQILLCLDKYAYDPPPIGKKAKHDRIWDIWDILGFYIIGIRLFNPSLPEKFIDDPSPRPRVRYLFLVPYAIQPPSFICVCFAV